MRAANIPPVLCVGFPAWEGDYQKSTVQLMQAMAHHHQVLYVEYPFTWKDVWQGLRHHNRPWTRILGVKPRLRRMPTDGPGELHVLTLPPVIPVNGLEAGPLYHQLAKFNALVAQQSIRQALKRLNYQRPLMINAFNPFLGAYLQGKLDVRASFYYCYDKIGAARWTHRHGPMLEERLLPLVDGIITSSQPLLVEKGRHHAPENGLLLKNGANVSLFEQAFEASPNRTSGPTMGYLGSIDDRIDVDLLLYLLDRWEEAKLLMVGRVTDPEVGTRLKAHPRIELTGSQPPADLPKWVKRMDIGLIPFCRNEFTRYIYPLKINEYLAAGLPVVSSSFGDLSDFVDVASVAPSPPEFLQAVQIAWQQDSPAQRKIRRAFAREQSWQGRALELGQWLARIIAPNSDNPGSSLAPGPAPNPTGSYLTID